ncbi:MAG: DUF3299 domain-containing protein [Pseudomonadota bacterium]
MNILKKIKMHSMDDNKKYTKPGSKMGARQSNKRYYVWLLVLILAFAANHIEYYFRMRSISDTSKKTKAVMVKAENGQMGHSTIGVDENSITRESNKTFLRFSTLGTWDYDPKKHSPCPESIQKLNSRSVTCIGFMYPLEAGIKIRLFALLRTTQTCCYGPRPQYNQYLFVEMKEPIQFERMRPVVVEGLFFVDPRPDEGYIYRLEATAANVIQDDVPNVNGAEAAEKANLSLFNFSLLENTKNRNGEDNKTEIPLELRKLNNSMIIVEGFLVGSTQDAPPKQIVGKYWWDGVMQGTPPDFYNAVMVFPKDESQVPPAWKQKVVFTGVLHITVDKSRYADNGIISIRDAIRGVPGQNITDGLFCAGPILAVWQETAIFVLFLMLVFRKSWVLGKQGKSAD